VAYLNALARMAVTTAEPPQPLEVDEQVVMHEAVGPAAEARSVEPAAPGEAPPGRATPSAEPAPSSVPKSPAANASASEARPEEPTAREPVAGPDPARDQPVFDSDAGTPAMAAAADVAKTVRQPFRRVVEPPDAAPMAEPQPPFSTTLDEAFDGAAAPMPERVATAISQVRRWMAEPAEVTGDPTRPAAPRIERAAEAPQQVARLAAPALEAPTQQAAASSDQLSIGSIHVTVAQPAASPVAQLPPRPTEPARKEAGVDAFEPSRYYLRVIP